MKKTQTLFILAFVAGCVAMTLTSGCQKPARPVSGSANTSAADLDISIPEDPEPVSALAESAAPSETEAPAEKPIDEPKEKPAEQPKPSEPAAEPTKPDDKPEPKPAEPAPSEPKPEEPSSPAPAPEAEAGVSAQPKSPVDKTANAPVKSGDWAQWAGTSYRNNTPIGKDIPTAWEVGDFDRKTGEWISDNAENIKWVSRVGSQTYGNPVVAGGRLFVGTNNGAGWLKRYPSHVDLGCLLAFNEADGKFLWQDSSEKLPTGRVHDWPLQGICCAPLVEGDRLWYVTSRGEVKCLDAAGFYDDEDDGPDKAGLARIFDLMSSENPDEDKVASAIADLNGGKLPASLREGSAAAGVEFPQEVGVTVDTEGKKWTVNAKLGDLEREFKLMVQGPRLSVFKQITTADKEEADVIWVYNMMTPPSGLVGISQHNMCSCSVTTLGDILFVNTSNGVDESHINIPAPDAPTFMAMDKNTGEVLWTDKSPGLNILHGQWSSPTVAKLGGVDQVIFGGGDGWVYSFQADKGSDGKPTLLWKFDANPKTSKWVLGGRGTRNNIIATPVVYDGLVYVAVGQDPEHGEGIGHLWCIDPTKSLTGADVSPQLAMKITGDKREPIAHRRLQAVVEEDGEVAVDNTNSAVIWHYSEYDQNGDGEFDFEETMHRSCGTVAIQNDILYIADFSGLFHCLDAKTGKPHWTYDMLAAAWGSPCIVDGHVFIGDEDGDVCVFELNAEANEPLAEINMGNSVYSTPIVANDVLYIANKTHVFAIKAPVEGAE